MGFFEKISAGLRKTRESLSSAVSGMLSSFTKIDDALFEELEEILILADTGVPTAQKICDLLRERVKAERVTDPAKIQEMLEDAAAGKLPRETVSAQYELEYGTSSIELHKDAIRPGQKVVIIDDLIATGGTVKAIAGLVEQLGGQVVKICFVMELAGLKGRERLSGYDVESAIIYEGK